MILMALVVLCAVLLSSRRVRAALPGEALPATLVAAVTMLVLLTTGNLS